MTSFGFLSLSLSLSLSLAHPFSSFPFPHRSYSTLWGIPSFMSFVVPKVGALADCADIISNCWITPIDTVNVFHRCLPSIEAVESIKDDCIVPAKEGGFSPTSLRCLTINREVDVNSERPAGDQIVYDKLEGAASFMMKVCADLTNTSYVIFLIGVLGSFALAWCWVIFLQYFAAPIGAS